MTQKGRIKSSKRMVCDISIVLSFIVKRHGLDRRNVCEWNAEDGDEPLDLYLSNAE